MLPGQRLAMGFKALKYVAGPLFRGPAGWSGWDGTGRSSQAGRALQPMVLLLSEHDWSPGLAAL